MQKENKIPDFKVIIPVFLIDRIIKIATVSGVVINSGNVTVRGIFIIISISLIGLLKIKLSIPNRFKWLEMFIVGGISNLMDIFMYGGILDNIHLFGFYQNFSDILITAGIVLFILELIKWKK